MDPLSLLLGQGAERITALGENTLDTAHAVGRESLIPMAAGTNMVLDTLNPTTPIPDGYSRYIEEARSGLEGLEYDPVTPQGQANKKAAGEGLLNLLRTPPTSNEGHLLKAGGKAAMDALMAVGPEALDGADMASSMPGLGALKSLFLGVTAPAFKQAAKQTAKETLKEGRKQTAKEAVRENGQLKRWDQLPVDKSHTGQARDFMVLSAERQGRRPEVNARRTEWLRTMLTKEFGEDTIVPVQGRYKGVDEQSFMVDNIALEDYDKLAHIARMAGQESVLTPRGLLYTTGDNAGKMHPLKSRQARDIAADAPDNFSAIEVKSFPSGEPITKKFEYDIDWDTLVDIPTTRSVKRGSDRGLIGVHRSVKPGLDKIDPAYQGTGSAGAETARYGDAPERSYHYKPIDPNKRVRPEPTVHGRHPYRTDLDNVYNLDEDAAGLKGIALDTGSDLENLIQRMGASGYHTDEMMNDPSANRRGMAVMFDEVDATPMAQILKAPFPASRVTRSDIYGMSPEEIARFAESKVGDENPALQRLFGVNRGDLFDMAQDRGPDTLELDDFLPFTDRMSGNELSKRILTPDNADRLANLLMAGKQHAPRMLEGMGGWYVMDPVYQRLLQLTGDPDQAFRDFNHFTTAASPQSDVLTELQRGTSALAMHTADPDAGLANFLKYGNIPKQARGADYPDLMAGIDGNISHRSHAGLMQKYADSGEFVSDNVKVPLYQAASSMPHLGFSWELPVPDAHYTRGVGLPDVRLQQLIKGERKVPTGSLGTPEAFDILPWYRDEVAAAADMRSVPAQAFQWGLLGPQTGVATDLGVPKLELLARSIMEASERTGLAPEMVRDMVLTGAIRSGK